MYWVGMMVVWQPSWYTYMYIQCTHMYIHGHWGAYALIYKARQHTTCLRKSFFSEKNWLPQVGFEPTTLLYRPVLCH